jgi:hypothetical protein
MKKLHLIIVRGILFSLLVILFSPAYAQVTFKKITLSDKFVGEGPSVGDFNKDGHLDVAAGPFLWMGPNFTTRYKIGPNGADTFAITQYAYYYVQLRPYDVNNDGWLDIPFQRNLQTFMWLENPGPGKEGQVWKENTLGNGMGGESAQFVPLFNDKENVLISGYNFNDRNQGPLSWSQFDKAQNKYVWHIISEKKYRHNSHGLGIGDVNGDKRNDIIVRDGWYEQPASIAGDPLWKYHPYLFSFDPYKSRENLGGSHIFVDDVDKDGDGDVIAALEGHGWGLAWYEQIKQADTITFIPHMIMGSDKEKDLYGGVAFSQLHSLGYVDVDGDGLKDIVTGKRYYAHVNVDPDGDGPAVLYWFKQTRKGRKTSFVPMLIDSGAGSGSSMEEQKDIDGDGHPDIVTSSKKGTYIFLTRGYKKSKKKK